MADRILTKGLKTGTGVGGIKYILRRGLVSSIPVLVSHIKFAFGLVSQSRLDNVVVSQSRLDNMAVSQSRLDNITVLE